MVVETLEVVEVTEIDGIEVAVLETASIEVFSCADQEI